MEKFKTYVANLKCGGCAASITKGLESINDVSDVAIDVENSIVEVAYTADDTLNKVHDKLINMGYPPTDEENNLMLKGKSYISCMIGRLSQ